MLQVSLHGFRRASMCFSWMSWEEEKEWRRRKRIKSQGGHYVTTSIFQDAVLKKSSWVPISAGAASWDSCLTQEEELQKAHTTGSQALQRALEAGKYQTATYSKPNNNSGSFCHLLTLGMYLQPTPEPRKIKSQYNQPRGENGSQEEGRWRRLPKYLNWTILVNYCTGSFKD